MSPGRYHAAVKGDKAYMGKLRRLHSNTLGSFEIRLAGADVRYLAVSAVSAAVSWLSLPFLALSWVVCATGMRTVFVPALLKWRKERSEKELGRGISVFSRRGTAVPAGRPVPYREDIATVRRELIRTGADCLAGLLATVFVLAPVLAAVACATTPLWWWLLPEDLVVSPALFGVRDWTTALLTPLVAVVHLTVLLSLAPYAAVLHARVTLRLLTGEGKAGLAVRLAEVTASRAEALDAHAAELRRIERALHDGTQNRLVSVQLHLGIVERLLDGDPEQARTLIRLTRSQADEALAELRSVVRGMYPPVLADRGLAGAISALTLRCPVPCAAETGDLVRIPAAVEVAVYYSIAEALTNAVKHGDASHVKISVRADAGTLRVLVTDDGRGGAREVAGGGLAGIRQRIAAFDGATEILSPSGGPTTIRMELPCVY